MDYDVVTCCIGGDTKCSWKLIKKCYGGKKPKLFALYKLFRSYNEGS